MTRPDLDIYHTTVPGGCLALAWVNSYSAVVVKTPGAALLFDPVSLAVPQDARLDLIAVTHEHSDHWDPSLVADLRQQTGAVVVAAPFLASQLSPLPAPGVKPLQPGDRLTVGDVTLTALRCDHAARQPLAFLVRTGDGLTVYLPGDTTPFSEMADLPIPPPLAEGGRAWVSDPPEQQIDRESTPMQTSLRQGAGGTDILLWMGTVLNDGAKIAQLVQPKALVTYAITPPAAGERARRILTRLTPEVGFHALERHRVFIYSPQSRPGQSGCRC